jgi:CHAT domain-containing protein
MKRIKTILNIVPFLLLVSSIYGQNSYSELEIQRKEYHNKSNYTKELEIAYNIAVITKSEFGIESEQYISTINNIGLAFYYTSNYDSSEIYYLKGLELSDKYLGHEHIETATLYYNYAILESARSNFNNAEEYYLKAYDIFLSNNDESHAKILNSLGELNRKQNLYNKAIVYYKKAINYYLSDSINNLDYSIVLNNIAICYKSLGNYKNAETYYKKSLDLTIKVVGDNHVNVGMTKSNFGSFYKSIGNYKKAEDLYIEAKKILALNLDSNNINIIAQDIFLAIIYIKTKEYKKAEKLLITTKQQILVKYGTKTTYYVYVLGYLGNLYADIKQFDKAKKIYKEILEIKKVIFGKDNLDYAYSLNNLATLYDDEKKYSLALDLYKEAIDIVIEQLGRQNEQYTVFLFNIATNNDLQGQFNNKFISKAQSYYCEGIENINNEIIDNFSFLSEKEKELFFLTKKRYFDNFYSFTYNNSNNNNDSSIGLVFNNIIRNKGMLLKSSTAMKTAILDSKDTSLINLYNRFVNTKKTLSKLYPISINKRTINIDSLEFITETIEKELVKKSSLFNSLINTQKNNWKTIQKKLNKNEVAIEFIRFNYFKYSKETDTTIYCALIVKPKSKYPEMIKLFNENQLEQIIGKFGGNNYSYINSIYGKNTEVNKELYNLIWKPMEESLKGVKKVYLSPDGLLHKISFSAIAKKQNVYLCDVYDIEVKSSTGKIIENTISSFTTDLKHSTATIFGGITYDTDSTTQKIWSYLEGTKTETQKINKILKKGKADVNYFSNTTATEEEFKLMASNSNILHIATHGFFYPDPNEIQKEEEAKVEEGDIAFRGGSRGFGVESFVENRNPLMRSGLVFAGANDVWSKQNKGNTDDGVLTAQEVSNIDMRKTDLVVMSACETGLGDIKGSEGVYGLQRAFKMAGVDFMIMSLWQVPDKETEEFMTTFYTKLLKLKNIKQAFAQTQKEMRTKYDPYFWAAFVLIE